MAKKKSKSKSGAKPDAAMKEALRRFVRTNGHKYLRDPNVTSIGVGRKNGAPDGEISLIFTVGSKVQPSQLEALDVKTKLLPETIEVAPGVSVKTDVEERRYEQSHSLVEPEDLSVRKSRQNPIKPGISVGQFERSAGTLGAIVFDEETGAPCILSNWHVLHTDTGEIGDRTVQPGHFDDNDTAGNEAGLLLRSHLGAAGDCALSRIRSRGFDRTILDLGVKPSRMADVELDDPVVKSGRTSGVTYGVVRRTDVMVNLFFGPNAGNVDVGGFEIGVTPQADLRPGDGEISRPGDSGSLWMIREGREATDIVAGLHFAGETSDSDDEHALACYPLSVQKKLRFTFDPPKAPDAGEDSAEASAEAEIPRSGYDASFLGLAAPTPVMTLSMKRDAVNFGRAQMIPYTHFSVCLSAKRRLARFVAWNVDGARKVVVGGSSFRLDRRYDASLQVDNSLYSDNMLDRGHIARRADLAWGSIAEARQASWDSYFYTNIAPQHERYNRSSRAGIWGKLENLILEQAAAQDIRCSVFAGPVFGEDDPVYRGIAIPRDYWKLIAYRGADGGLRASCFVLSQNNLLSDIETLDLDPFRMFQVSTADLAERTGLGFDAYASADVLASPSEAARGASPRVAEALTASAAGAGGSMSVEILGEEDLLF
ncbi:MAG: DNA/RNA non-specific endonuclease [Pseudomonadota bacterium]